MKPEIILTAAGHAGTQATLMAEFDAHKFWEAPDKKQFVEQHRGARGLATFGPMTVDGRFMDQFPKLEIIANFGVGVDAINLADAKQRNIIVTNTPDVLNECVADTGIALVLNTLRKLPQSERYLRAGNWVTKGPYPLCTSLGGKTMGILGLGRIGEAVAKRAMACGMKIRYHNRNKKDVPYPYDPDPVTLAKNCDVLMVVTPASAETNRIDENLVWFHGVLRRLVLGVNPSSGRHKVLAIPAFDGFKKQVCLSLGNCRAVISEAGDVHAPNRNILKRGDVPTHRPEHQF